MKTNTEIREQAQKTFQNHLDFLSSGRVDEWVSLWDEKGVLEFPFPLPVYPEKVEGKVLIREYMRHFPETIKLEFSKPTYIPTEDPSLVIAEFTAKGHMLKNGRPYDQKYISVVYTKEGKITQYKDFWNPLVALTALGENNNYQGALNTLNA